MDKFKIYLKKLESIDSKISELKSERDKIIKNLNKTFYVSNMPIEYIHISIDEACINIKIYSYHRSADIKVPKDMMQEIVDWLRDMGVIR